ncbi:uncharacterized protein LOC125769810 isoform X1 [Anopheles funestus]|uniref:uncharacterized protein LOC125769810 isoform X1 n=1 Tax=Anopheles funestus TaxID=62324 RepID=UPI0020C70BE3|nr:uncharacterized protein LOC125769810 isoform X1 [Anopheles funestus]XP_049294655.1 uncharacterized protein LOC125769810 isoform X1 [Anopheles funestus]XP_049294663.1 uncharacterized protein LOC125769810 isoform X1 [Anopheles funestus]XP_049294671.1 uncharacterized protein LOC125769810 isoform X1 [Anopheles funestus]XP_049294679.1 uncharacterized protein LOC125769810 isoform X1 [Anopheles funestus]XP_049294690.1 uncharacterized protein LOC125769810 isoform X1 [Anopheles funestus]XP_04929470
MNTSATTNTNNKINISNNNAINDKNNTSCPSSAMLNSTPRRGTKRKIATVGNGISTAIRKRRKLQNASKSGESRLEQVPQTKNTVAVLNELKRNLVYKVESQTGPVHAPLFTISVVVDGQKFVGTGPSKKLARVAAAASALRSFIQFKDGATLTPIEPLQNVDFTSDDPMIENSIFPLSDTVAGMQEKIVSVGGKSVPDNNTVNSLHSINNNSNHNNNSGKSPYGNSIGNSIKPIANRQCDFSGNNTTVHANNTNSKGAAVPSNGSNWQRKEAIATGSVHSITDSERQPPVEKPTTGATAAAAAAAASSLPNVNSSVTVRTAPAAASSIVTNIAATGTTYNDSYEQYISVSTGGGTTTVTASTGTTLKTSTAAIIPLEPVSLSTSSSSRPTQAIIPKQPPISSGNANLTNSTHTTNATNTTTATILMLPLAGYVMSPSEQLLAKTLCTTAEPREAKPHEVVAAGAFKKLKAKNAKTALAANGPLSAAGDFHRFVNYIQYDSFMLNGTKKQTSCHNNYFNKFGNFDTPINSYLSLVRNDLASVTSATTNTKLAAKAIGKDGSGRTIPTGGGGVAGVGGIGNTTNATTNTTTTTTNSTGVVGSSTPATSAIANGSNPATAIVIVTSPTSVITTHPAGDKGYMRDCPSSNTVSYPFPNTAAIPPNLTPYAQNGHRQVVEKIQQSLNLFKNTNEKALAWKKRFEKLKVSSGTTLRNSGNVTTGHHPKPQPEKGPVMLLHELFTDAHFECVSSDGLQHSKFTVVVTVHDNQRFEGTGPSKKMAKNAAAKAALASICNISFSPLQQSKFGLISAGTSNGSIGGPSGAALNGDNSFTQNKNFELPQTFADAVGKLVIEKFNEVMKGSDVYSRRKVLAGFVMTHGYDVKTARVISLATGTKCVSGEHMSVTGSVINDSHAEIIARRGLMDFFYSQLDLLCQQTAAAMQQLDGTGSTASVHDTVAGNETEPGASDRQARQEIIFNKPGDGSTLYTLKEGIYFHLYINTAPCGDARVFSPHENDSMDVDKHPNRKARGQLRTKVESGEGTIPVKSSDGIQTWDGVLQGQRLLTMSCSDKISRWNVLGLQGSLLASIIEPIYLHSIVLGSLLHPAHMYRAICGRIESAIQGLPPPYRLNKPKLALMTSAESRNQTKPPNFSINWITNGTEVEIVNSFTGKLINNNTNTNKMSRLSKQSFYQRYSTVIARLPGIPCRDVKPTYFETKTSVAEYQQAKRELFAAFSKEDLGEWLKKPIEQDQFTLIVAKDSEQPPYANQTQTVPMPNDANAATVGNVSSIGNSSK